jgi:hypothetical protein
MVPKVDGFMAVVLNVLSNYTFVHLYSPVWREIELSLGAPIGIMRALSIEREDVSVTASPGAWTEVGLGVFLLVLAPLKFDSWPLGERTMSPLHKKVSSIIGVVVGATFVVVGLYRIL